MLKEIARNDNCAFLIRKIIVKIIEEKRIIRIKSRKLIAARKLFVLFPPLGRAVVRMRMPR